MALLNNQSLMAKAYLTDWPGLRFVCTIMSTSTSEYAPLWLAAPAWHCKRRSMS